MQVGKMQCASVLVRKRPRDTPHPRLVSPVTRITSSINLNHKRLAGFIQIDSKDFQTSVFGNRLKVAPNFQNAVTGFFTNKNHSKTPNSANIINKTIKTNTL